VKVNGIFMPLFNIFIRTGNWLTGIFIEPGLKRDALPVNFHFLSFV
jgi:hypothetical protein